MPSPDRSCLSSIRTEAAVGCTWVDPDQTVCDLLDRIRADAGLESFTLDAASGVTLGREMGQNFRDAGTAREEIEYIRTNPHRDALAKIFRIAGIDYGRIDYGLVDGTVQTYEINTNPRLPRYGLNGNERTEQRRILIRPAMEEALRAIDKPLPSGPDVPLHSPDYTSVNSDLHRHPALHRILRRLYHAMR